MAKKELSGTVTAFRQSKFKQDSYQTIVEIAGAGEAGTVLGARVVWLRKDGLQLHGRELVPDVAFAVGPGGE